MLPIALPAEVGENLATKVTLAPALIVCAPNPVILNPAPEAVALVMFRAPLPEFVTVTFCDALLLTATLPNATLVGLILIPGCNCVPIPISEIFNGDPGASLAIETLPAAEPATVGENFAVNEVLCPALRFVATRPLIVYPAPDTDPPEIETLPVPLFVRVTDTDPLPLTGTLPKFTLDGFATKFACVPLPLSAIVIVGFVALLTIVTAPVALPVDVGANFAVNVALCPAFSVVLLSALMVNPFPVAAALEIVMLLVPEFESVMVCVLFAPTTTLPNAMLPGFALSVELAEVPVPARSRVCGELAALSVNLIVPVIPCATPGVNCAVNDMLFPAAIVAGRESPVMPKPVPET